MSDLTIIPDLDAARARFWRNELQDMVGANPEALARIVRRQRLALGWTQETLADLVGISRQYIALTEAGNFGSGIGIGTSTVRVIMNVLALTIDDLRAEIAAMYSERSAA